MELKSILDDYNKNVIAQVQLWNNIRARSNVISALADDPTATQKSMDDFTQPYRDKLNAANKVNRERLGAST